MVELKLDTVKDIKESIYNDKLVERKEKWKYIRFDGEKTHMLISTFGRVKNEKTGKINDFRNYKSRYHRVDIPFKGKVYKCTVHRLVAIAFCKIPKRHREKGLTFDDLVPNHKDGIKHHNASFNLEWITQKENTDHAWKTGLCDDIRGEKSHLAKMTEEQAIQICDLIMEKKNNQEIHDIMGVSKKSIQHIRSGECWKHIVCKYNFPKLAEDLRNTIPVETIHAICKDLEKKKYSDPEIARRHDVKREYVKCIRNREIRKDISINYDF